MDSTHCQEEVTIIYLRLNRPDGTYSISLPFSATIWSYARQTGRDEGLMHTVTIRFYEELNDFLPNTMQKRDVECTFPEKRSVKDLVESFGVPHTEVDLILVNGSSEGFDCLVRDGDRISVYPVFESFAIDSVTRLRRKPLRDPRFVCDIHLGKLARRLRLLGFDTLFPEHTEDATLVHISRCEKRILLTRDRRLLMRNTVTRGMCIRSTDPEVQVEEVLDRFDLRAACRPFTRCTICNGGLAKMTREEARTAAARGMIPPRSYAAFSEYYRCLSCGRVYWKGSHWDRLVRYVAARIEQ